MKLETKCEIGDTVLILAGGDKIPGIVMSFSFTRTQMQYQVVFWNDGKREVDYFWECELEFREADHVRI